MCLETQPIFTWLVHYLQLIFAHVYVSHDAEVWFVYTSLACVFTEAAGGCPGYDAVGGR